MLFKTQKYSSIPTSPASLESLRVKRRKCSTGISVPLVLNIVLVLVISMLSFLLGRQTISLKQCGKKLSTWSPIIDVVEYEETTFEGSFLAPSVWRGEPTPELDAAWDRISLGGMGSLRISKDDLQLINKSQDADITVGFPDEGVTDTNYGHNDVQVLFEVFHQLHCLNEIRKKTWPEYYPKPEKKYEKVDRVHIDHCIEMLRINLMCTADVTPITANIRDTEPFTMSDFSTLHTCRNFDKILGSVRERAELWGFWA